MLAELLSAELFPFFLVFIRLGAAMMMMPAIGENGVSTRARLLLAIALTAVVTPLIADTLPAQPAGPIDLGLLVIGEVVIGLFFGATTRMVMAALHVAGMIFAFQSSLAAAMMFDPNQSAQSSLFGNFLNLLAVVFIFATDLHHMLLRGLVGTYGVFPAGNMLPTADSADLFARVVSDAFRVGFQIAAPVLVTGFLLYLGAGLLNRLMPQMMVFFVLLPIQIMLAFAILMLSLPAIIYVFISFYDETWMSLTTNF